MATLRDNIAFEVVDTTGTFGAWELTRAASGWEGRRYFLIPRGDINEAILSTALPAYGDAWGPNLPDTKVTRMRFTFVGGKEGNELVGGVATDVNGWTLCEVEYADPSVSIDGPGAFAENDAYCECRGSIAQVPVRTDILGKPIREANIEASTHELLVKAYKTTIVSQWQAVVNLSGKVNTNAFTTPPFFGVAGSELTVGIGEALMRPMVARPLGDGLIELEYRMGIAPDWMLRWSTDDADGNPTTQNASEVYLATFFDTDLLWGTSP